MSRFGGMTPYPRRWGGDTPRAQDIFESLAADMGTAYDATNPNAAVYVQTLALARALSATWGTNERLARLWQPMRCSLAILRRWERILLLPPSPDETVYARRVKVFNHFAKFGRAATKDFLTELLSREVPDAFVAVDSIGYTYAIARDEVHVPDNTYGFGTVLASEPWSSSVDRVLIRLTFPTGWSTQDFLEAVGKIYTTLDPVLPSWATIDWYSNNGPNYTDLSPEGPSGAGFFLDQEHNLDASIFDTVTTLATEDGAVLLTESGEELTTES